jgi:hypothetical protein
LIRKAITIVLAACAVAAMLPPFFTHGACTAEFDSASSALEGLRSRITTLAQAQTYFTSQAVPFRLLSAQRCESAPPRDVEVCPGGPILLMAEPVKDSVCRYYRDDSIRLQMGFNSSLQLVRIQSDMNPYRILRLPIAGYELDWAK